MTNREHTYYNFLVTLSRLFEREDEEYIWYDGWHIGNTSIYVGLYENYLDETRSLYHGPSKASNSNP